MHNSPGSQIAVSSPSLIMYSFVLSIGRPIGMVSKSLCGGQSKYVTSTVASVGPYRFVNRAPVLLPQMSLNFLT